MEELLKDIPNQEDKLKKALSWLISALNGGPEDHEDAKKAYDYILASGNQPYIESAKKAWACI
jgi:hypothetical protein